jgi:hypothetical protein
LNSKACRLFLLTSATDNRQQSEHWAKLNEGRKKFVNKEEATKGPKNPGMHIFFLSPSEEKKPLAKRNGWEMSLSAAADFSGLRSENPLLAASETE